MVTPPTGITSPEPSERAEVRRKKPQCPVEQERAASPVLKEREGINQTVEMSTQRTPQPTLTQTKLTGFGVATMQGLKKSAAGSQIARDPQPMETGTSLGSAPPQLTGTGGNGEGDGVATTSLSAPDWIPSTGCGPQGGNQMVTTDFLLRSLKENTDQIIKSFTAHLGALSNRVDDNAPRIAANSSAISKHDREIIGHGREIEMLSSRVRDLEMNKGPSSCVPIPKRVELSDEYLVARRSLRLWPVPGADEQGMWEAVGEFIHGTLLVPESDIGQDDIESVERVAAEILPGRVRDEVVVTLFDRRARDTIMSHDTNLAGRIDPEGRPTADHSQQPPAP